jgi:fibronectin type 3 domain-containing protein
MPKTDVNIRRFTVIGLMLYVGLFAACKDPVDNNTTPNTENPTENTWIEFKNLEQYPVTIYNDVGRNVAIAEVAALGSSVVAAEPASAGNAFYPTFHLDIFDMPGVSIPCNGESIVHLIKANETTSVPIPRLKSIEINYAYIKIINNSDSSLALRQGSGEKSPIGGGSTVINSGQNAAYDVLPGPASNYSVYINTTTPVAFPSGLTEFKRGIIYVITYNGTSLTLTDEVSVLQSLPPAVPENVQAEVLSENSVRITWNEVYGATSYRIYRATGSAGAPYSQVANTTTLSWTDTGLTAGEIYYYWVTALSGGSMESAQSAVVYALVMTVDNVRISAVTDNSVSLTWDAVGGANGYNVYRSDSENGTYTRVNHSTISGAGYTDTGLDPLTEYYYKVSATAFELEGILSSSVSCTTLKPAPSNVQLTSVTDGSINFTWDAINDASGYNIYRSSSVDGIYTRINSSMITQVSYADTGLSSNTNYHYKVSAVTDDIESAQSSVLSVATLLPVPENLRITVVTDISVSLAWNTVTGASGYNVYRSESEDGIYTKINSLLITAVSYTDTGVSPETNYYYNICAVSSEGVEGIRSNTVSVATPISAPDNLRVTSVTDNGISLAWNTVNNASGYNIYRSNSVNGTYTKLNSSLITNVTYADTGLVSNTGYYYKVSVMVDGVESIHSNAISGTTLLSAPVNLRVIAVTDVSVSLEWNTVTRASGYNVYRCDSENGSYTRVNSSMITAVSYTNTGVSQNTTYYYRVYAVSSGGIEGIPSTAVSAATLRSAPGNFRATSATESSVSLAWNTVDNASGYNVYRSNSVNGTYTKLNSSLIPDTSYTNTGLSSNTSYYYKVSVVVDDVESVQSGAISGTTLLIAPGGLNVTAVTDVTVSLGWNSLTGANGYNIYRSASENGSYTKVNTSVITVLSYTNAGVSPDTTYYYKVCAVSSGGIEGVQSSAVSAATLMPAPGNVRVTAVTVNSVSLAWNVVSVAGGYNVYRSNSENGIYNRINTGAVTGAAFTDTNVSAYTTYFYKVSAIISGIEGMQSSPVSASTSIIPGSGLAAKLNWLQTNAVSNVDYMIEVTASESIGPTTLSYSNRTNIGITLRGTGTARTVRLSSNGAMFTVASGVTLVLDNNITLQGRSGNNDSLVRVNAGGKLFMNTGSCITGNTINNRGFATGGGVYINGGTFLMDGGKITGNNVSGTSYTEVNESGAPINMGEGFAHGGGVYIYNGIFYMNGGEIFSNTATASNYADGGGVYVVGTFTMSGGTISGNTASGGISHGGGVSVSGGTIYNDATGAVVEVLGTFTMSGGTISGNTVSGSSFYAYGGGVFMSNGTFSKTGGTIYGYSSNTSNSNAVKNSSGTVQSNAGHAVYVDHQRRETTAGPTVNMNSSVAGSAGGWEN